MSILLVIYSCKKYLFMKDYYDEKYTAMGYTILFVFGDKDLETEYQYDSENRMAVLKCEDNFESLTKKTHMLFKMILTSSRLQNYEYIIKMDDDTELNLSCSQLVFPDNLLYGGPRLIKSEPKEHNYHFGKCSEESEFNMTPYELKTELSWGAGYCYILHRNVIEMICLAIEKDDKILNEYLYEDMMVGKIISTSNISYIEFLTRNIITDLSRPRKTSITQIITNKINFIPKSTSKIKRVSFNTGLNTVSDINYLEDKLNSELSLNRELDKKIRELSEKVNKNNNIQINNYDSTNEYFQPNRSFNPVTHRNVTKIKGRISIRR